MKLIKNIVIFFTILSIPLSFSLACLIGEVDFFSVAGMIRYSWIALLFIPIGIVCFIVGRKLKKDNKKYKSSYIVSIVCVAWLLMFGSFGLLYDNITYDDTNLLAIEKETALKFPHNNKIASIDYDKYTISYVKIIDENEKNIFDREISNNDIWESKLRVSVNYSLPYNVQSIISNFDYFVFYNETTKEFNAEPNEGKYIFAAYDIDTGRIIILNEYKLSLFVEN